MIHRILHKDDAFAADFIRYCRAHGSEHDESYVPDASWGFGADYPSFALTDECGSVIGAAAAMLSASYRHARRGRVAILHTVGEPALEKYAKLTRSLVQAIPTDVDELYLFFPEADHSLRAVLDRLHFEFDRSVYLLGAETARAAEPELPAGYTFSPIMPDDRAAIADFVAVRNRNFKEVHGSTDARPEDIAEFMTSKEYIPGGLLLLLAPDSSPCGTLRVERDDDGTAFIGTISVDRQHRRHGLGKAIINMAVYIAGESGFARAFLSVNATNKAALDLYERNGFSEAKAMVCYTMRLS